MGTISESEIYAMADAELCNFSLITSMLTNAISLPQCLLSVGQSRTAVEVNLRMVEFYERLSKGV